MKFLPIVLSCLFAGVAAGSGTDDWLDRLDETLTVSAFEENVRARLSGTIDLEGYHLQQPAPGFLFTTRHNLFNPRLTLFLDAQLGPRLYLFAQSRIDRGFDPSDEAAQVRLDEYALRFSPWDDGRLNLQVGKFSTVVGTWSERHLSWDNPFINAPLVYENITAASDREVPISGRDFVAGITGEKYEYNPVLWGPVYTSGASVAGKLGKLDYAFAVKNAALGSRPESWDFTAVNFAHPSYEGRVGWRPNAAWQLGFSASDGTYLLPEARPSLPQGRGLGDYHEFVLGQDVSFAWHHLELWAELYEARFEVPNVGNADSFAYYLEARYKFATQFFGAVRWNQQLFAKVREGDDGSTGWGHDIWRVDSAVGYRLTAHTQVKLQYSFQHEESGVRSSEHTLSAQFTLRF